MYAFGTSFEVSTRDGIAPNMRTCLIPQKNRQFHDKFSQQTKNKLFLNYPISAFGLPAVQEQRLPTERMPAINVTHQNSCKHSSMLDLYDQLLCLQDQSNCLSILNRVHLLDRYQIFWCRSPPVSIFSLLQWVARVSSPQKNLHWTILWVLGTSRKHSTVSK